MKQVVWEGVFFFFYNMADISKLALSEDKISFLSIITIRPWKNMNMPA